MHQYTQFNNCALNGVSVSPTAEFHMETVLVFKYEWTAQSVRVN
jgi:hypothetical protein